MGGQQQALNKCLFIIAGASHFGGDQLFAEGQAAVICTEPKFTIHVIAAGIAGESAVFHIESDDGCLSGGGIGR